MAGKGARRGRGERTRTGVALARLVLALAIAGAGEAAAAGNAASGERLFGGRTRFANGGPPCAACHAVAGLPAPGGGTMGPDLTGAYAKYGPEALDTVLTTLFFPTMNPLFAARLLSPGERADVEAFLAGVSGPAPAATARMFLLGLLLFAAFVVAIASFGRSRLRGVRAALVRRARSSGGERS
jgi:ubiquinol-cytochrome c reductase cytochrome c subunit